MKSKKLGQLILCAVVMTAVLALSACGGSGEPESSATTASSAQPASSATATPPQAETALAVAASAAVTASTPVAASTPDAASTPAAQSAPASTPVVQIDVYGDDGIAGFTTNSFGMVSMVTPSEQQTLQELLRTQFNDTGITVASHATGGTSSSLQNEMLGMDGNGPPFSDRIKQSPASIVIESHARNDALGGETVSDYRQYLAAWVVAVRAAGKIPVLEESGPVCDSEHPQLAAYVQAMDEAAAQFSVPIITQYAYISGLSNWQAHMASCLYPDSYLLQIKAQREAAVIAPIVKAINGE